MCLGHGYVGTAMVVCALRFSPEVSRSSTATVVIHAVQTEWLYLCSVADLEDMARQICSADRPRRVRLHALLLSKAKAS